MPSTNTITTFYSFTALTKIKSAEVNGNFSIFRGHIIPVDPNTLAAAATHTYDLGGDGHGWRGTYSQYSYLYESTTPTTPPSGYRALFAKADNTIWTMGDGGAEHKVWPHGMVFTTTSATYSCTSSDLLMYCNASGGAYTNTFPPVSSSTGTALYFVKIGTDFNAVTCDPAGSDTLDSTTTATTLNTPGERAVFHNDGSGWRTIHRSYRAAMGSEAWTLTNLSGTVSVRVSRMGNRVFADGIISVTGVATAQPTITIPAAYTAAYSNYTNSFLIGHCRIYDASTGTPYDAPIQLVAANTITLIAEQAGSTYVSPIGATSNVPMAAWASGDIVTFLASWEVSGWN